MLNKKPKRKITYHRHAGHLHASPHSLKEALPLRVELLLILLFKDVSPLQEGDLSLLKEVPPLRTYQDLYMLKDVIPLQVQPGTLQEDLLWQNGAGVQTQQTYSHQ